MHRRKLVLSLALSALIVLAGCSTFIPGSDTQPTTAGPTTTDSAHDHSSHNHDNTDSKTASQYNLNKKLYAEGQFLGDRILQRHTQLIEDAREYTITTSETHSFPVDGQDNRGSVSSTERYTFNLETQEHQATLLKDGTRSRIFQSPTDDYMVREAPDGTKTYFGSNATDELEPYAHQPTHLMSVANHTTLSFQGKGTVQGQSGYIYTATEASAFSPGAFQEFPFTTDQLETGHFTAVIGEDGIIKLLQLKTSYKTDAGMETLYVQKTHSDVNDVHAGTPLWVENAKNALQNPDPTDYLTQVLYEDGAYTGVQLKVTAQKQAFDSNAVFHRYSELPDAAPDALKKAAVGGAFQIYYPPDQTELIQGEVQYDIDHTPGKKGENLALVVYNPETNGVYLIQEAENLPRAEELRFTIQDDYKYAYQGQYVVLIHNPTYQNEKAD